MGRSDYHEQALSDGHCQRRCNDGGFTLIELIGVMTVAAILASVILPSIVKQIQIQAAKDESVFLERIDHALTAHLQRNKAFPDESGWAQSVATKLGVPVSEVVKTPQQSQRLYVIDPALRLGTEIGTLPFAQTATGSIEPVSPRVMILSSLDGTKPIPLNNGVIAAVDFNTVWDLPAGSVPPDWSSLWQLTQDDLKVQRINLTPLFHKAIVNNYDSINPGGYSVDDDTVQTVPSEGINTFLVEGTVLGLHDSAGELETRQIVRRSCAFTFERETWRGQVFQGLKLSGDDVYNATTLFAVSPLNPQAQAGAISSLMIDRYTDFMDRYVEWDEANFPGQGSESYEAVAVAQAALRSIANQLIYLPLP